MPALTLSGALARAAQASPAVAAASASAAAARARTRDAARRANPSLGLEAENWGGSLGGEATELTARLSQPIELGGKRSARRSLARAEAGAAEAGVAVARRDLVVRVTEDFLAAWAAQERLASLRESHQLAVEAVEVAAERHRVGAASALERIRAEGHRAVTRAEVGQAEAHERSAAAALALHWGESQVDFGPLALPRLDEVPPAAADAAGAALREHPESSRAAAELAAAEARVRAARAERVPDLEASIGGRHFRAEGESGLVAALSLPLPLWNGGGGEVAATESERTRAAAERDGIERRLEVELRSALDRLSAGLAAWVELRDGAAPSAEEALANARAAYRAGRSSYIDLVETQRDRLRIRLAMVDATVDLWRQRAMLATLTGSNAILGIDGGDR
jgi:cobalt-zinc-cadmium efflux system outer membrane protein